MHRTHSISPSLEAGFSSECEIFLNGDYGKLDQPTFIRLANEFDRRASGNGQQPPGWNFARYWTAYPHFASMTGEEVYDVIDWSQTHYTEEERENCIAYFNTALFAPGENILTWSSRMAKWFPLRRSKRSLYDQFVSLTGWMQVRAGQDDIFYAQEDVAVPLGCTQPTVHNMTQSAIRDGYLQKTKEAIPHVFAAHYRFNLSLVEDELEKYGSASITPSETAT
jgi:hypothetical protein